MAYHHYHCVGAMWHARSSNTCNLCMHCKHIEAVVHVYVCMYVSFVYNLYIICSYVVECGCMLMWRKFNWISTRLFNLVTLCHIYHFNGIFTSVNMFFWLLVLFIDVADISLHGGIIQNKWCRICMWGLIVWMGEYISWLRKKYLFGSFPLIISNSFLTVQIDKIRRI